MKYENCFILCILLVLIFYKLYSFLFFDIQLKIWYEDYLNSENNCFLFLLSNWIPKIM